MFTNERFILIVYYFINDSSILIITDHERINTTNDLNITPVSTF